MEDREFEAKRTALTRRGGRFAEKDLPLKEDVRLLGGLVGEVIAEQGGEALFERVEGARRAAIRRRQREAGAEGALYARLTGLEAPVAGELVRAFSAFFQVVNLAETVHRIRRRRDYRRRGEPQAGSLLAAFRRLAETGVEAAQAGDLLGRLAVEPVFTAHPTEATRRTLLEKEQRIARLLVERFDPSRPPREEASTLARIRAEVTTAWQTEEHPSERPTVGDEREHVLFYLTDVLYRVLPRFYEEVEEALAAVYGDAAAGFEVPVLVRFASWVGGDMDGNPNVGAETIRTTLERHRRRVLDLYQTEVAGLSRRLSQSLSRVGVDRSVLARIDDYGHRFPQALAAVRPRIREMPYRVLLRLLAARLEATREDRDEGYADAAGFAADLDLIAASLERHWGSGPGSSCSAGWRGGWPPSASTSPPSTPARTPSSTAGWPAACWRRRGGRR